jgi:hypothetical protein
MAADLPENYEKYPVLSVYQRRSCRLGWKYIPSSRTGDYITIARKAKGKESWFLGAITDENARTNIALTF